MKNLENRNLSPRPVKYITRKVLQEGIVEKDIKSLIEKFEENKLNYEEQKRNYHEIINNELDKEINGELDNLKKLIKRKLDKEG